MVREHNTSSGVRTSRFTVEAKGPGAVAGRRWTYNGPVEPQAKVVRIFKSHAEADEADALADAQLTPAQRIQRVIELRDRLYPDAAQQGLARVCRIIKLEQS